jgi:hypothetical protein
MMTHNLGKREKILLCLWMESLGDYKNDYEKLQESLSSSKAPLVPRNTRLSLSQNGERFISYENYFVRVRVCKCFNFVIKDF